MSTETELSTLIGQTSTYKDELEGYIKSNENSALLSIITGALLMLGGIAVTAIILYNIKAIPCLYYACSYANYTPLIITILVLIGAIVLFTVYKSSLKQAEFYRNERIVLHDLNMALCICLSITDDLQGTTTEIKSDNKTVTKKISEQTKVKEQIIETLLNSVVE